MSEELEQISLELIATSGTAKSLFVEAMNLAKIGNLDEAEDKMKEAKKVFIEGHKVHAKLLALEANDSNFRIPLLIIHAEDQMASVEVIEVQTEQIITLYKVLKKNHIDLGD